MPKAAVNEEATDSEDTQALLVYDRPALHSRLYKSRWYVLTVFSFLASYQGAVYNFYNVIPHSVQLLYGWDVANLAMLNNWSPITTLLFTPALISLLARKGLRAGVLLSIVVLVLSTMLRCATLHSPHVLWFANVSAILLGVASPILNAAQPVVAAVWFSHKERVTATTLSIVITNLAISSLLGLYFVRDCGDLTMIPGGNASQNMNACADNSTAVALIGADVAQMAYIECGVAALLFGLVLAYFPSKPATPPSASAGVQRTSFSTGVRSLLRRKRIWLVVAVGSLSNGVYSNWISLLPVNMQQLNIDQKQAAWMNFYASLGTAAAGIFTARLIDRLSGKMKWTILCLLAAGLASILWIVLQFYHVATPSKASMFASIILAGTFIPATVSLVMELSCEAAYPAPEGVAGGLLLMCNNLVALAFLLLFLVPGIGVAWMNWVMLGSMAVCIVLMLTFKEVYTRMMVDVASSPVLQ